MKCRIGNNNLKVWGKAIQTLISTGDGDVHFQFTGSLVTITTFDSTLTVSCSSSFEKEFFDSYEAVTNDNGFLACRVPSKCLLKAFRSQRFLTKSVISCEISLQENSDNLEIALLTKFGPVVRYSLRLAVEIEALEIDCCPERLSNWIKVNPKFILGAVSNFGPTNKIADLTLKTLNDKIQLKNCTTDVVKREGKIYTELSVNSLDFAEYIIRVHSEITVPLREFKAFVSFAEGLKLDLSLHFQGPKDPVIIVIQNELFKATLNLATKVVSGNNTSINISPVNSGLISNVSSQEPPAVVQTKSPMIRHKKSTKNAAAPIPVVEPESDAEEGIFDQVNNMDMYRSINSTFRTRNSSTESDMSERVNDSKNLRKSKSSKTNVREVETESDVEIIGVKKRAKSIRLPEAPPLKLFPQFPLPDSDSLLGHVNEMESEDLEQIRAGATSNEERKSSRDKPPKKRVKTFDSLFPNFREVQPIPGMDVILLPASDEEDC